MPSPDHKESPKMPTQAQLARHLNSALHGAGSDVDTGRTTAPRQTSRYQDRRDAGDYGYAGEQRPPVNRDEFGRSIKSVDWLRDLLTNREIPPHPTRGTSGAQRAEIGLQLLEDGTLTQKSVSQMIDLFKDLPRKGSTATGTCREHGFRLPCDACESLQAADDEAMGRPVTPRSPANNDLERVAADLLARSQTGRLNDFGQSLWDQYTRRGTLSDRQVEVYLRGMEKRSGSGATEQPLPGETEVPAGRYAVDNAEGVLTFYRIKRSDDGSRCWIHLEHGPSESEVPFTWAGYRTILKSIIDAGPLAASQRYASEIGRCGVCNLRLTNKLSRELNIGPICGGRFHADADEWTAAKAAARAAIRARGEDPNDRIDA